jgi:hypothetical protein
VGRRLATIAAAAAATAAAFGSPASAASINATAKAKVVKPLTIESRQNLDFGTIMLGPGTWSGAVVRLSQDGTLTCPASVTCAGATSTAIYNVAGSQGEIVVISAPPVTMVNQADSTKTLTLTPDAPATVRLANSGNPGSNFNIGGAITVNSTTADGNYVGTFNVTADYQ